MKLLGPLGLFMKTILVLKKRNVNFEILVPPSCHERENNERGTKTGQNKVIIRTYFFWARVVIVQCKYF